MAKIKEAPRLPGMENPAIEELEDLAISYAKVRDRRQALTKQEVDLKVPLLAAMKKHKKNEYHHGKIHVVYVVKEETVKVKIEKDLDD